MWSRYLVHLALFSLLTIATQNSVRNKRGLISQLLSDKLLTSVLSGGGGSSSPAEHSKVKELLKNPLVVSALSLAVGALVQKYLSSRNKDKTDVCENNYVKAASLTSSSNPELKQLLDILGCKGETSSGNDQEKKSKFQSIMAKVTGDHGTGGFWKKIFGGSDNSKDFNAGTKLPDSNYELDESDAKTLNHFQKHH